MRRINSGFAIIEILLVLIVIAMLSGWYFTKGSSPEEQAASQYQQSMDRSKATACIASRSALRTAVMAYSMQNPGNPLTKESLTQSGVNLNVCPEQGEISVQADGTLTCSKHQP